MSQKALNRTYVLRLYQEQAASADYPAVWRFMLIDPRTGQRRGFDQMASLMAFLQKQMDENNLDRTLEGRKNGMVQKPRKSVNLT
jgi:hypothetical protein